MTDEETREESIVITNIFQEKNNDHWEYYNNHLILKIKEK